MNIDRKILTAAVDLAAKAVDAKSYMPILQTLVVRPVARTLTFEANALDYGITVSVPVEQDSPRHAGAQDTPSLLNASTLKKALGLCAGGSVSLEPTDKAGYTVKAGSRRFTLPSAGDVAEFPLLPPEAKSCGKALALDAKAVTVDWAWLLRATGTDVTRAYTQAIYLDAKKDRAVTTDGHRLHVAPMPGLPASFLIPSTAAALILAAIKVADTAPVELSLFGKADDGKATTVRASVGSNGSGVSAVIWARGVDADFPPIDAVIPAAHATTAMISANTATAAAKLMLKWRNGSSCGAKLSLGEYGARLSLDHPENGEATEAIEGAITGPAIEVGLNPAYLVDALSRFEDAVTLKLTDDHSPVVVHAFHGDKRRFAILMPTELLEKDDDAPTRISQRPEDREEVSRSSRSPPKGRPDHPGHRLV